MECPCAAASAPLCFTCSVSWPPAFPWGLSLLLFDTMTTITMTTTTTATMVDAGKNVTMMMALVTDTIMMSHTVIPSAHKLLTRCFVLKL